MPLRTTDENMVVATRSFTAKVDGETIEVLEGRTRVRGDDPLVALRPDAWRVSERSLGVENMTAAPGEKR